MSHSLPPSGNEPRASDESPLRMEVLDIRIEPPDREVYRQMILITSRGDIACHYYAPDRDTQDRPGRRNSAIVWLAGAVGGFRSPARGLYPDLAARLADEGIASVQVAYRHSTLLPEATLDTLAALTFLRQEGFTSLAVVGHSFGGAVAINAAAAVKTKPGAPVRCVATLATQSLGGEAAGRLSPHCSLLLLHGTRDELLPPACSRYVLQRAACPAELRLIEGGTHFLDSVREQVESHVLQFLRSCMGPSPSLTRVLRLGASPGAPVR